MSFWFELMWWPLTVLKCLEGSKIMHELFGTLGRRASRVPSHSAQQSPHECCFLLRRAPFLLMVSSYIFLFYCSIHILDVCIIICMLCYVHIFISWEFFFSTISFPVERWQPVVVHIISYHSSFIWRISELCCISKRNIVFKFKFRNVRVIAALKYYDFTIIH